MKEQADAPNVGQPVFVGRRELSRDDVAHSLCAASHLLEAASHVIMTGGDASSIFAQASDVISVISSDGREALKACL